VSDGRDGYRRSAGRRGEILETLRGADRPLRIADLADRIGVHPNTVRFHLDTLVANGRVEQVEAHRSMPGRPPQLFRAVAGMDPAGPRHYRLLAEVLAESLTESPDPSARAVAAGRAWGRRPGVSGSSADTAEDPVARLGTLLDELGFSPEGTSEQGPSAESGAQIHLRNCPFLELAVNRPQIACPIHLGIMQGAMDTWNSPVTVDRLEPFVEPDRCVAHLALAGPGGLRDHADR